MAPDHRRARRAALGVARRELAAQTEVTALVGDVADDRHRRAIVAAAAPHRRGWSTTPAVLGISPQPAARRVPVRRPPRTS
jgi:hypothetical protein